MAMNGTMYVVLSGALTFGVPLALAVRELIELRRRDSGGREEDGPPPEAPRPPPRGGERTLPDCLRPIARPSARVRELEEV
ncbi:MAG: hypothetical protein NVSMB18_23810 [Acetobacteraceae bacterium]